MKKTIKFLLSASIVLFLSGPAVQASEIVDNEQKTPVTVEIIESPIRLSKVTAPTFGTYYSSDRTRTIKATGDLVIGVTDQRSDRTTPWVLKYGISTFLNDKTYDLKMHIGKGAVSSVIGATLSATTNAVTLKNGESKTLVEAYSTEEKEFTYQVVKKEIAIEIPANLPDGKFVGKQYVVLVNTPSVN